MLSNPERRSFTWNGAAAPRSGWCRPVQSFRLLTPPLAGSVSVRGSQGTRLHNLSEHSPNSIRFEGRRLHAGLLAAHPRVLKLGKDYRGSVRCKSSVAAAAVWARLALSHAKWNTGLLSGRSTLSGEEAEDESRFRMNRFGGGAKAGAGTAEAASADQLEKQNEALVGSLQSKIAAMKNVGAQLPNLSAHACWASAANVSELVASDPPSSLADHGAAERRGARAESSP